MVEHLELDSDGRSGLARRSPAALQVSAALVNGLSNFFTIYIVYKHKIIYKSTLCSIIWMSHSGERMASCRSEGLGEGGSSPHGWTHPSPDTVELAPIGQLTFDNTCWLVTEQSLGPRSACVAPIASISKNSFNR